MPTNREALYATVKAGGVVTVRWSDGFALPPWPVAWVRLSDDEKLIEYHLVETDGPDHQHEVDRIEQRDDSALAIHVYARDMVLTFELAWELNADQALRDWLARMGTITVEGGAAYATV